MLAAGCTITACYLSTQQLSTRANACKDASRRRNTLLRGGCPRASPLSFPFLSLSLLVLTKVTMRSTCIDPLRSCCCHERNINTTIFHGRQREAFSTDAFRIGMSHCATWIHGSLAPKKVASIITLICTIQEGQNAPSFICEVILADLRGLLWTCFDLLSYRGGHPLV